MDDTLTLSERADALEERRMREFGDSVVTKSLPYHLADGERTLGAGFSAGQRLLGRRPTPAGDARRAHYATLCMSNE